MRPGKPLARKAPLRRTRRMKRKTSRRVLRMTAADKAYQKWIHTQPCCADNDPNWRGEWHLCLWDDPLDQSHERDHTGMALKAKERRSVRMCRTLHRLYERHHVEARDWMRERIAEANEKFDREQAAVSAKERTNGTTE